MVRGASGAQAIDTDALLELVGEAAGVLDLHEFRSGLLDALRRAVPADWASVNDLGPDPDSAYVLVDPPLSGDMHELFARLAHENPLIARHARTGDGRAYRFSDVATRAELHSLALYREFYRPIGLEHQVAFALPHDRGRLLGVALSRRERDFADEEVALLNRARPFLIQAYRNAIAHSHVVAELARARAVQLPPADGRLAEQMAARRVTAREVEVLRWAAAGRSDGEIASALGISSRTVQKHLERSFRKLAVRTRADAARLVWTLVGGGAERAAELP
jgi:DNA-binding CsgD family transcriptional regulator